MAALILENFLQGRKKVTLYRVVQQFRVYVGLIESSGSMRFKPPLLQPQAIWLSVSADLAIDAERDLRDAGALRWGMSWMDMVGRS